MRRPTQDPRVHDTRHTLVGVRLVMEAWDRGVPQLAIPMTPARLNVVLAVLLA